MDIEAFVAWVRENGTPADVKIADSVAGRTTVIGLLSLKKGGRLTPADVAQAARLARDAKTDATAMVDLLRLGELLLEFQSPAPVAPRDTRPPPPDFFLPDRSTASSGDGSRAVAPPPPFAGPAVRSAPAAPGSARTPPPPATAMRTPPPPTAAVRTPPSAASPLRPPPPATAPVRTPQPATAPLRTPPSPTAPARPPSSATALLRTPPSPTAAIRTPPVATAPVRTPVPGSASARGPSPAPGPAAPTTASGTREPRRSPAPTTEAAEPATEEASSADVFEEGPGTERSSRWAVAALVGLVLVVGTGLGIWRYRAAPAASSPQPTVAAADPVFQRVLDLSVTLPPGWSHDARSGRSHAIPGGTIKMALLHQSQADPAARSAFVGVLPLTGDLQKGSSTSDRDLLAAARNGQTVIGMELDGVHAHPELSGCAMVKLAGRRTARCNGATTLGRDRYGMRTYLAIGRDRALLFVFFARSDAAASSPAEESLVSSVESALPL